MNKALVFLFLSIQLYSFNLHSTGNVYTCGDWYFYVVHILMV